MKPIIFDWGNLGELALRLARELGECLYFSPWAEAMPTTLPQLVCTGLEDFGVKRTDFPFELIDTELEPDLFVFPELYFTDLQSMFRRQGRAVWGSGWGELLELDRWKLHTILENAGWPVADLDRIVGVRNLERKLRMEYEKRFIKLTSYYRGTTETYEHRGWPHSRTWFEKLRADVGPRGDTIPFMWQSPVPGDHVVEPGLDLIIRNGQIVLPVTVGYEKKDDGLISQVMDYVPDILAGPLDTIVKALGPDYSNFFSIEGRLNEDGEFYVIDATCRVPRPGDAVHQELWSNLGAVITSTESPKPTAKYACQLMLQSAEAAKRPLHIEFPKELRNNLKLYYFYRDEDGEYWTLPNKAVEVAAVVAIGDDLAKVRTECLKIAEEIKADGLAFESHCFDEIEKDIAQGEENGIPW